MSHNPHAAPAKFKLDLGIYDVETVDEAGVPALPQPPAYGIKASEGLRKIFVLAMKSEYGEDGEGEWGGWKAVKGEIEKKYGKKYEWIIATKFVKGKHEVWFVDESEGSNVGCTTPSFIAFDRKSIEALKKDIGGKIETDTTVMNWW